ncbi:hypothetical protein [Clostridium sp.]|uniref:hypothetical protein n=1 Tax=Clostridium sp. TaxID=1506 RepID=UPI003216A24D
MARPLTQDEFMTKVYRDLGVKKPSKKENEADTYLKTRGADSNRRYAMHRKRSGR